MQLNSKGIQRRKRVQPAPPRHYPEDDEAMMAAVEHGQGAVNMLFNDASMGTFDLQQMPELYSAAATNLALKYEPSPGDKTDGEVKREMSRGG